jgi:hypothetical protein
VSRKSPLFRSSINEQIFLAKTQNFPETHSTQKLIEMPKETLEKNLMKRENEEEKDLFMILCQRLI